MYGIYFFIFAQSIFAIVCELLTLLDKTSINNTCRMNDQSSTRSRVPEHRVDYIRGVYDH